MKEIIEDTRKLLFEAVKRNPYKGLLFSGGLDTSILAVINPKVVAVSVSLGSDAEDIYYSKSLADFLKMEHFHKEVDVDEALAVIPEAVKILQSFDPAIPNDLVVYLGFKKAKELGIDKIATGDGSDELFAGYSFMTDLDDLESYIRGISKSMYFSSNDIGEFFGLDVIQPFLDREVIDFALEIPTGLKISSENGRSYGKWILRKAFEDALPKDTVWQSKRPLEYGSGMNRLRRIISERVNDEEYRQAPSSIKFISKEHFYYYKIYKETVGEIPGAKEDEKACRGCGGGMGKDAFHCKICGHVLKREP